MSTLRLSPAMASLVEFLAKCERATPRTILRETCNTRATIEACRRRGLVSIERSVGTGIERVYITPAGREASKGVSHGTQL